MTLSSKINLAIAIITGLLLTLFFSGQYSKNSLIETLQFITDKAWSTADGSMETIIAIEKQMLYIERMRSGDDISINEFQKSMSEATESLRRLENTKMLPQKTYDDLNAEFKGYANARQNMLQSHKNYTNAVTELNVSTEALVSFGEVVEEHGDSSVEELENNPERAMSWNGGLSLKWEAADGGMESNIGFLRQLYYIEQIKQLGLNADREKRLRDAIEFQMEAVESMTRTGLFDVRVDNYPSNKSMATIYKELVANQRSNIETLLSMISDYHQKLSLYQTQSRNFVSFLDQVESQADSIVEQQLLVSKERKEKIQSVLLIIMFICGIVFIFIAIYSRRVVLRTLVEIAESLQQVASGDGDLTRRLAYNKSDELGHITEHFNTFAGKVARIVKSTKKQTDVVSQGVDSANGVFQSLASRANKTAQYSGDLSGSMYQMQEASNSIAQSCALIADETSTTEKIVHEGQEKVLQSISDINSMVNALEHSSNSVQSLKQKAKTIDQIVTVIRDISEQTNLLALNAAIEAARAGEQGRGFAVVADEVRNLANRSAESSQEISNVISGIQEETNVSVNKITHAVEKAQQSVDTTQAAGILLNDITTHIRAVNEQIHQVASAAQEQNVTLTHINKRISEVAEEATLSDKEAQQSLQLNQDIMSACNSLIKTINTFKLD